MKNLVKDGKSMPHIAASDISSGDPVVVGGRIAIAVQDISTGKSGELALEGVYSLAASTSEAFSQGQLVYWDGSELTSTPDDNTFAGEVHEAKAMATASASVRLGDAIRVAANVADASSGSAAEINAIRDALVAAGLMANS